MNLMNHRQILLDTETTGIDPKQGHRIIEIGCVEIVNRRFTGNNFHCYVNPQRYIEEEAIGVHGITNEFLTDKPLFAQVADEFFKYINGAELVIHNAPFDVGFMDYEFMMYNPRWGQTTDYCTVVDTLTMARKIHPGQKNNLDALCRRYGIDNSHRLLHGALLDSEILADVYLAMTGGQKKLKLNAGDENADGNATGIRRITSDRPALNVVMATDEELAAHEGRLDIVEKKGGSCMWRIADAE